MNRHRAVVVFVCIAVFVCAAIAVAPVLALLDARTPADTLFWSPTSAPAPPIDDAAIPAAPVVDVRSPRPPPVA